MANLDYSVDIQGIMAKDALSREGATLSGIAQAGKAAYKKAPEMLNKAKGMAYENVPLAKKIGNLSKSKVGLGAGMTALAVAPIAISAADAATSVSDYAPYAGASQPMQTDISALTNNNTNDAYSVNTAGITNATYH